jgi:hypothetical protein
MRELQWPEVLEAIREFSRECEDPSTFRVLTHISSAYDKEWTYESSFPYYVEKALKEGRQI